MQNYDTIFINFDLQKKYKYKCVQIEENQNLVPNSENILKEFLHDLNKNKYPWLSRYWYISFFFLIIYIIFFFLAMFSSSFYILIALIFLAIFLVLIVTIVMLISSWHSKIEKVKENYENKLKNFYKIENYSHGYYRKRSNFRIKLFPIVNGQILNNQMYPLNGMMGQVVYDDRVTVYNNQMYNNTVPIDNFQREIPINNVKFNKVEIKEEDSSKKFDYKKF